MESEKVLNKNFLCLCGANFLFFFSFYLILPILPIHISNVVDSDKSIIGFIISTYSLACLCIRPFSGYMMDAFYRKPLYITTFSIFGLLFLGYPWANSIALLILVRMIHGLGMGSTSVGGNTLIIDVPPASKRGEAVGIFGIFSSIAMAIGPMTGIFLYNHIPFKTITFICLGCCALGITFASFVQTKFRPPIVRPPLSLDRFILKKGLFAGGSFMLIAFAYGQLVNYIAMYASEIHLNISSGYFFTIYAIGLMMSRVYSGKMVDKGYLTQVITVGTCVIVVALGLLAFCTYAPKDYLSTLFLLSAWICGIGYGITFPAYNNLFINLAPNNKRGTATSTYLTSWDLGIGIGIFVGGSIAERLSFSYSYAIACMVVLLSIFYFIFVVTPHYHQNKLR